MKNIKKSSLPPNKDNENSVQTILRVAGNLDKFLEPIWVTLGGILMVFGFFLAYESITREIEYQNIEIAAGYIEDRCTADLPISVVVKNKTNKTLERLYLEFTATEPGRSSNVLGSLERSRKWDFIIKPNDGTISCYGFSKLADSYKLSELKWSVKIIKKTIKFSD